MQELQNNLSEVSAQIPDWSREKKKFFEWSPSKSLLKTIRDYQRHSVSKNIFNYHILRRTAFIRHIFWSVVSGADIPLRTKIAGGLYMPHPNGIVISPDAIIGPNCLIFQQVTIGSRSEGVPVIGGHVDIGAGAKVLGNIKIGNHALIGANAVVLTDVPQGKTAVGIPAKIIN
jgi:serine O-acetyltransferase